MEIDKYNIPFEYENQPMEDIPLCLLTKKNLKIQESLPKIKPLDAIWEYIFDYLQYDLLYPLEIDAKQIRQIIKTNSKLGFKDVRLLCKQDFKDERPKVFQDKNLCILPIKNGTYLIMKTDIYFHLDKSICSSYIEIKKMNFSLLMEQSENENIVLDYLFYQGIFESKEILGENILYKDILRGRRRCSFTMNIENRLQQVEGVQIETDAVHETQNKVLIVECKCGVVKDSFNIRQIYYPYRYIHNVYGDKKEIIPIFVWGKMPDIYIWQFKFENLFELKSIVLQNTYHYKLIA